MRCASLFQAGESAFFKQAPQPTILEEDGKRDQKAFWKNEPILDFSQERSKWLIDNNLRPNMNEG